MNTKQDNNSRGCMFPDLSRKCGWMTCLLGRRKDMCGPEKEISLKVAVDKEDLPEVMLENFVSQGPRDLGSH